MASSKQDIDDLTTLHIMQRCNGGNLLEDDYHPRIWRKLKAKAPHYAAILDEHYRDSDQMHEVEAYGMELQSPDLVKPSPRLPHPSIPNQQPRPPAHPPLLPSLSLERHSGPAHGPGAPTRHRPTSRSGAGTSAPAMGSAADARAVRAHSERLRQRLKQRQIKQQSSAPRTLPPWIIEISGSIGSQEATR